MLQEPLWESERDLVEALLARYEATGENGGGLLAINAATAHLALDHGERTQAWSRLMSRHLLETEAVGYDVEWDRTTTIWAYRLDLARARAALCPPASPGPRTRLSPLAASS